MLSEFRDDCDGVTRVTICELVMIVIKDREFRDRELKWVWDAEVIKGDWGQGVKLSKIVKLGKQTRGGLM